MIKIENTKVYGFEEAIRGMRNPMNSWDKSDSWYGCKYGDYGHTESSKCDNSCKGDCEYCIGNNDLELMKKACQSGNRPQKIYAHDNGVCRCYSTFVLVERVRYI